MPVRLKHIAVVLTVLTGLALIDRANADGAATPVAIELVLAVDVSLSVDDREFELQMGGILKRTASTGSHPADLAV